MIPLSRELAEAMPGLMALAIALIGWWAGKHTATKARREFFAKYGRYPEEPAPKQQAAE